MTAWEKLLRSSVREVGAYTPGISASEIKQRFGLAEVLRLNWNENLFGPLPGVLDDTAAELGAVWAYPEESYVAFQHAVADWAGAEQDQIIPGHGIQGLTLAVVSAFIEPGDAVVIPHPTYGLYAQACRSAGAITHRVPVRASLALDLPVLAARARRARAKLVWVCDPNNPTGLRLGPADWTAFLEALPEGCIAIADEAYGDFIEPGLRIDRVADVRAGRPVIILRSFSKIFGLAGLRLGYALVHASLAPHLHAVQEPFNVNRAALAAGLASLRRVSLLSGRREEVLAARERLTQPLLRAGIRCLPSDANFVLVELGADDLRVTETLARQGLLVRPGSEFGLPGFARVTVASADVMGHVAAQIIDAVQAASS
jgi:histidinol-phosphate aminotransferase